MRVLCLALGLALSLAAGAQAFPSKPVHFVVPNAPGGAIDSLRKLLFDTVKDFAGVTLYGVSYIALAATPGLRANALPDLIALARSRPGQLDYASPGSGSSMHLAGEQLKAMAGI